MGVSHHWFHLLIFFLRKCACLFHYIMLSLTFLIVLRTGRDEGKLKENSELMWKPPNVCHGTWHTIISKETQFLICMPHQWQKHNNGQIALIHLFTCSVQLVFDWILQWGHIINHHISLRQFFTLREPFLVSDSMPLGKIVLEDRNQANLC